MVAENRIVGYEVVWTTPMGAVARALFMELPKAQQYAMQFHGVIYPLVRRDER